MIERIACFLIIPLFFCGCQAMHLQERPQKVFIDSNVTAWVYDGDRRLGETPFFGEIDRSFWTEITLQKPGYETVEVPLKRRAQRKIKNVSDYSLQGVSSYVTFYGLPLITDFTGTTRGYWIEYMPNSYYVELIPDGGKQASAKTVRDFRIKEFALKNFPHIAAHKTEYLETLGFLTQLPAKRLGEMVKSHPDAVSFTRALAALH